MKGMLDAWLDLVHGTVASGVRHPAGRCAQGARRGSHAREARASDAVSDGLAACFAGGEYDELLRAISWTTRSTAPSPLPLRWAGCSPQRRAGALEPTGVTVLVPVPSRAAVVRSRGHYPVLRFTKVAARDLRRVHGHRVRVAHVLEQRGPVLDLAGLDRGPARRQPSARWAARHSPRRGCAHHEPSRMVCDDVLTTGATAREAQRALEESGLRTRAVVTVAATRKRLPPRAASARGPRVGLPLSGSPD